MKLLKLYKVGAGGPPALHVAARSAQQAAQIFITYEVSQGRAADRFAVELVRMETFDPDEQIQLRSLLRTNTEGIAHFDAQAGWSVDSDGWTSFDLGEEVRS